MTSVRATVGRAPRGVGPSSPVVPIARGRPQIARIGHGPVRRAQRSTHGFRTDGCRAGEGDVGGRRGGGDAHRGRGPAHRRRTGHRARRRRRTRHPSTGRRRTGRRSCRSAHRGAPSRQSARRTCDSIPGRHVALRWCGSAHRGRPVRSSAGRAARRDRRTGRAGDVHLAVATAACGAHAVRAPDAPFGPGHRGVDLAGSVGAAGARRPAAGTVVFAGPVAGHGVVSVQHDDGLRTTYEPRRPDRRTRARSWRRAPCSARLAPGTAAARRPACTGGCAATAGVRRSARPAPPAAGPAAAGARSVAGPVRRSSVRPGPAPRARPRSRPTRRRAAGRPATR